MIWHNIHYRVYINTHTHTHVILTSTDAVCFLAEEVEVECSRERACEEGEGHIGTESHCTRYGAHSTELNGGQHDSIRSGRRDEGKGDRWDGSC